MKKSVWLFSLLALFAVQSGLCAAEEIPVKIGNPLLARYPTSGDPDNSRPRSIWDMHYFNRKIYLGNGDYWNNRGPVDLWTYNGTGSFVNEYTVAEEMVFDFFEYDHKLFIPGNDATEDWTFGNLYINDPYRVPDPGWKKLRTLPGALHSFDVALFKGNLYEEISTDGSTPNRTLVSTDMGETWTTFLSEISWYLVVFPDFMFIHMGDYYKKYDGTTLQTVTPNLFPGWTGTRSMDRRARFVDGVLYAPVVRHYMYERTPLFFLPASEVKNGGVATQVAKFATDNVRDMVVRGTTCYVMTAAEIQKDVSYKGRIYSSTDLTNWTQVTEFTVPGLPYSFEIMNNKFYVGLGGRYEPSLMACVGPESGSVWEVTPPQPICSSVNWTRFF